MIKKQDITISKMSQAVNASFESVTTWTAVKTTKGFFWKLSAREIAEQSNRLKGAVEVGIIFDFGQFTASDLAGKLKATYQSVDYYLYPADNIGEQNKYWVLYGNSQAV
jgi:predicted TIM-barrel enzyme